MKKAIRIFSLLVLASLYCFAIGIVNTPLPKAAFSEKIPTERSDFKEVAKLNTLHHTFPSKAWAKTFSQFPVPSFDKKLDQFSAFQRSVNKVLIGKLSQYLRLSNNFPIRSRKADNIFPFHYFW